MINDLEICIAIVFYKPILQSNDSSMIFEASLDKNLEDGMMPNSETSAIKLLAIQMKMCSLMP